MSNHLIFAATGAIASGVARALAPHGTLWLAGRDDRVEALADELRAQTTVHTGIVDATREDEVADFVAQARQAGIVESVFNGIGGPPAELHYPKPTVESSLTEFLLPIDRIVGSTFLTSREAGRVMAEQGHGSIITLSATLSGMTPANMAGITATCGAIEALTRALAGDFGPQGGRVNCVRGSAMPETRTIQHTFAGQTAINGEPLPMVPPPLGRPITVADTAEAVAFLATGGHGITGQVLTVCAGQFVAQG